jgi:hypothetical protein
MEEEPAKLGFQVAVGPDTESQLLTSVVAAGQSWLSGSPQRSIKLELDGDILELGELSSKEQWRLADEWAPPPRKPVTAAVHGTRSALTVAGDDYQDPGLRRPPAPATDAQALARVLRDPDIGGFEVRTLLNQPAQEVELAAAEFFADRWPDDLLLHFSCQWVIAGSSVSKSPCSPIGNSRYSSPTIQNQSFSWTGASSTRHRIRHTRPRTSRPLPPLRALLGQRSVARRRRIGPGPHRLDHASATPPPPTGSPSPEPSAPDSSPSTDVSSTQPTASPSASPPQAPHSPPQSTLGPRDPQTEADRGSRLRARSLQSLARKDQP